MKKLVEVSAQSHKEELDIRVVPVDAGLIRKDAVFREACEQNLCGHYSAKWMCPPAVGTVEELTEKLKQYKNAVVIQSIHPLKDDQDTGEVFTCRQEHIRLFMKVREDLWAACLSDDSGGFLGLSAGECMVCKSCNCTKGKKCRFPDKAVPSLESYCIDADALLKCCSLNYHNGENTVSFVSLFLLQ